MSANEVDIADRPEMAYFMNESRSDVVFIIEGKRLPALKQMLSVHNTVFDAMFSPNFKESKAKEVNIEDATFDAFRTLIQSLYFNELVLSDRKDLNLIEDVCKIADRYQASGLVNRLATHLKSIHLTMENLKHMARIAFVYNMERLISHVMAFIDRTAAQIMTQDMEELKQLNEVTNGRFYEVIVGKYRNLNTTSGSSRTHLLDLSIRSRRGITRGRISNR